MTNERLIFTRIDFTLADDATDNFRYREAVSKLLEAFEDYLIGFQAEDLRLTNEMIKNGCKLHMSPAHI